MSASNQSATVEAPVTQRFRDEIQRAFQRTVKGVEYFTALWVVSKEEILKAGYGWIVFVCMVVMCLMMALGLAYSIFPDIVIGKLDIWESASSTASLEFALIGTVIAVPMILFYTEFIYKIFYVKSKTLSY